MKRHIVCPLATHSFSFSQFRSFAVSQFRSFAVSHFLVAYPQFRVCAVSQLENRGDLKVRRRRRLFLQICHVANAGGGEAMLFDRGGAARRRSRGHGPALRRPALVGRLPIDWAGQVCWADNTNGKVVVVPRAERKARRPHHPRSRATCGITDVSSCRCRTWAETGV